MYWHMSYKKILITSVATLHEATFTLNLLTYVLSSIPI